MSRPWQPSSMQRRYQAGFTLIEMLVTLVIVSMISTLLWQAMQQVFRVERVLQSSGAEAQLQIVRREWLRSLIEATLPGQLNTPPFRGSASEVWLISAEAPNLPGLGTGQLHLSIQQDLRTGRSSLTLQSLGKAPGSEMSFKQAGDPITLLSWTGPAVSLKYLNASGQWLDEWPRLEGAIPGELPDQLPVQLPRAVLINFGDEAGGPLFATITSSERPRMLRADWERQ